MQQYDSNRNQVERITLLSFARNVALPGEYSIKHLMDRLHTGVLGSARDRNLFDLIIQNYEVSDFTI